MQIMEDLQECILTEQAMSSMSSEESKPRSVMSRNKETNRVVSGGRSIKYHRVPTWPAGHHSTWPGNAEASSSPEQPAKRRRTQSEPSRRLPPSFTSSFDDQDPDESYKVVYKTKMRKVYGSKANIADEIAGMELRSRSSAASIKGQVIELAIRVLIIAGCVH